ncbi:hypothetical protein [Holdemanella porci]|uniref:hypothetical protein n=1 Tax=Holdemanella porci TaxID=2652276 RepID=UPI003AB7CC46
MAKYGIIKSMGLKISGMLDIRMEEERVYIEIEGKTYSLALLLEEYDGQDIEIKTEMELLPEGLEEGTEDEE